MLPVHPDARKRRAAFKQAGNGILTNGAGVRVKELDFEGAVSVGVIMDGEARRSVFKTPNPLQWAKWALKVYGRLCDDIEIGSEKPEWPFPISPDELHRRVVNQRRRIAREKLAAAVKQAREVDAGEKNASKSKKFDCAARPAVHASVTASESNCFNRVIADLTRVGV